MNTENLGILAGLVGMPVIRRLEKGGRLGQRASYKRVAQGLYRDIGDTQEVRDILDRIKPIQRTRKTRKS